LFQLLGIRQSQLKPYAGVNLNVSGRLQVLRIGHGYQERVPPEFNGQRQIPPGNCSRHVFQDRLVYVLFHQSNHRQIQNNAFGGQEILGGNQAGGNQELRNRSPLLFSGFRRFYQLLFGYEPSPDQLLTQPVGSGYLGRHSALPPSRIDTRQETRGLPTDRSEPTLILGPLAGQSQKWPTAPWYLLFSIPFPFYQLPLERLLLYLPSKV
jgi:hypothetical protein